MLTARGWRFLNLIEAYLYTLAPDEGARERLRNDIEQRPAAPRRGGGRRRKPGGPPARTRRAMSPAAAQAIADQAHRFDEEKRYG